VQSVLSPTIGVDFAVAFLGGLAGSLHCIGMCGGLPLALASARLRGPVGSRGAWANGASQVLYNLGRLNTLMFVGALSGAVGGAVVLLGAARAIEGWLAVGAGALMIAIGLEMLGLLAQVSGRAAALVQATLARGLASVIASRSALAPVALGVFNAFLPCHLIYAFAAQAAATASPAAGALTMLAFGLGTIPAMLAVGMSGGLFGVKLRARLSRASGLLVVGFGALTLVRGIGALAFDEGPHAHHGLGHAIQAAPAPQPSPR
jgi:sulfite exporter TauE/SafE